jgi:putative flippase GtrA
MPDRGLMMWLFERQKLRYVLNGVAATLVHYLTLRVLIQLLPGTDVGLCNMGASVAGITASFLGNRHLVFAQTQKWVGKQLAQFLVLYGVLASIQGALMHGLVASWGLNITLAFLICTAFQFVAGFSVNKYFIFHE